MMHRRRALLALLAASSTITTTAEARPPNSIISRASSSSSVCPRSDLLACPSALPPGFCCPADTACQPLAGDTTALCCPSGRDCSRIRPIACDVALQDPRANPGATVITSVSDVKLAACGTACCPFGYACADSQCVRSDDQSKTPKEEEDASSSSTTTTKTAETTKSSSTGPAPGASSTEAHAKDKGGGGGGGGGGMSMSMIGGIVGGSIVAIIIVVVVILCIRRRRRRSANFPRAGGGASSSTTPARQLNISEPIIQQDSYRTDFMLKSPSSQSSISNRPINSRWSGLITHRGKQQPPQQQQQQSSSSSSRILRRSVSKQPAAAAAAAEMAPHYRPDPRLRSSRLTTLNPFDSPDLSSSAAAHRHRVSRTSSLWEDDDVYDDDKYDVDKYSDDGLHLARTGHVVSAKLAPIRNMRASSQQRVVSRHVEPEQCDDWRDEAGGGESIDVFADANTVKQQQQSRNVREQDRMTTFTELMEKADLGDVHRGKTPYVP